MNKRSSEPGRWRTFFQRTFDFVSGEWLLYVGRRRANGGGLVLVRALFVTTEIMLPALLLADWRLCTPLCEFSWKRIPLAIADHQAWIAAIFAGVYTSLYSRFSSQWLYVADVYNKLMAAQVGLRAPISADAAGALVKWKAGFVEDAEDLHLARKTMFAAAVVGLLSESQVRARFECDVHDGPARAARLLSDCEQIVSIDKDLLRTPVEGGAGAVMVDAVD